MKRLVFVLSALMLPLPAAANIEFQYYDRNPSDGFSITNMDGCPLQDVEIIFDLKSSIGGVVFDTQPGPPGLNRSQDVSILEGEDYLTQTPFVQDGSHTMTLEIKLLPPEGVILIGLDTDFVYGGQGAMMYTPQIDGGLVKMTDAAPVAFDNQGTAIIPGQCGIIS